MLRSFLFLLGLGLATSLTAQTDPVAIPLQRTELTADDMEVVSSGTETRAICVGNVMLTGTNLKITCDRLEVVVLREDDPDATLGELKGFKHLFATGNVRIVQGLREATCGRAEVLPLEDKVVLSEDPVVLDRASDFVQRGDKITLFRGEQRMHIINPVLSAPPIQDLGANAPKDEPADTTEPAPETN
ncbi:LptA/OstA family protein [Actomonas aquatica]|uniref:LptA/OstA family protein n=1 Tax=Actomonas aquatica TaxID=2866162 RepID=A0ABZ1CCI9_9BACT|nr:LptA/OstA family protein [Opitutus sp. WL0086]WRQ89366.1 LptA/OstA family protein [Opitutus sp. WL0086]